jgi:hypothetical protein
VLFIDPFVWSMAIGPQSIAAAIRWARSEGWTPAANFRVVAA